MDEQFMQQLTRLIFLLVRAQGGKFTLRAVDLEGVDLNTEMLYWEQSPLDATMTITIRSMNG